MPIKSPFKRSLLNVQPLPEETSPPPVNTLGEISSPNTRSGYNETHVGFSTTITRQEPPTSDSADSITLAGRGSSDSQLASSVSTDPERPELISVSAPFRPERSAISEILNLRNFEASMDESDISYIYARLMESEILSDIEKRYATADEIRVELEELNSSLMEIVSKIEKFRDSSDFLLNSYSIHKGSTRYLSQLPRRFGENVETVNPTIEKTFANMEGLYGLSNTSLVNLLVYTLLYPGSVKFSTIEEGNPSLYRFSVPNVLTDPVNQLLTSIAGIDVKTAEGYLAAESLLPSDPVSRIALISEALSYELCISAGTKRLGIQSIISYIQETVGTTPNIVSSPPADGTVVSALRSGNILPLEIRDTVIDGVQYLGALTSLVDNSIVTGTLDFANLQSLTQGMSEKLSKLLQDILVLRLLDDRDELLSPTGMIVALAAVIRKGTSSLEKYLETGETGSLSQQQISQILLFKELANSSGSSEILESRFRTLLDVVSVNYESAVVEDSAAAAEERSVNTSERTAGNSGGEVQRTKVSIKSNIEGSEDIQLEVESQAVDKPFIGADLSNISSPSISAMTTLSVGAGMGISISSSQNWTLYNSPRNSYYPQAQTYPEMERARSMAADQGTASSSAAAAESAADLESQQVHETFTGRGGTGHLSSTYQTNFDLLVGSGETNSASTTRSDIFERYGLTLGIAGLLGIGDIAKRSLSGEDLTLTLENLIEIGVVANTSDTSASVTNEEQDRQTVSNTQSAQNQEIALPDTSSQDTRSRLLSAFGTIPNKRTSRSSAAPSKSRSARTSYGIAGMSTVLNKNYSTISKQQGGQITPLPKAKKQQDTIPENPKMMTSSSTSVRSESLFGLSSDSRGIEEYSREISKTKRSSLQGRESGSNARTKSDSIIVKQDESSAPSILSNRTSKATNQNHGFANDPKLIGKQALPFSGELEISATYKSFLRLFPSTNFDSSQLSQIISMSSLKDSLKLDTVYDATLLSGAYREFVDTLLRSAGIFAGNETEFLTKTSNYSISRDVIEFLCFSMFISMCSYLSGVTGRCIVGSGRQDFDISVTPQPDTLAQQQNMILAVSLYNGSLSELIMRFEGYTTDTTLFDSLRYAENVTETTKNRWAVLQNFLSSYSSAVSELVSLSSNQSITDSVSKIVSKGESSLLSEITYETVTNSQLVALKMRGPLKLDRRIRQYRTALSCVPLFLKGYTYESALDSVVACVGIPARTLEFLRRKYQSDENISAPLGKEYVEITFTKQDIQFPDLVLRSATYRFCPVLEVALQPTTGTNVQTAMNDFLYLCHNGSEWESKSLSDALDFVMESTGLDELSSYVVIVNHVIDALCNLTNFALGSLDSSESTATPGERVISSQAAELLLKMMKSSVGSLLPRGRLRPGDFLKSTTEGYRFIRFSSLNPGVISLTNESNHRLLGQIVTDPLFTAENLYSLNNCFVPFERMYNCVIDPDEFVIDKSNTMATSGGRATFDLLVSQGAIDVYPDVAVFKEGTAAKILEGSTYATKVDLVTI